jgi:Mce-associated membrane protein
MRTQEATMPVRELRTVRRRVVRRNAPEKPAVVGEVAVTTEGGRWLTPAVLAVLLAVALAAAALTGQRWYDGRQLDAAHQAALAAAKQTTVDFMSISASTVDADLQRIVASATGDFRDEFTRGMPQVRAAVVENNVQSRGTVLRAGLVSGDRDSAVVLVAVDATVRNAGAPDGRLSHYRIQVDLALDAGRWLVSRLQFVG